MTGDGGNGRFVKREEGKALFRELMNPANLRNLRNYADYLGRYEEICQSYDPVRTEPFLKMRLALYFRGEYYFQAQELIRAEEAYWDALHVWTVKETVDIISNEKIKCRILQIYFAQNNMKRTIPLLRELLAVIDSGRENHGLSEDDIYNIYTMKCYVFERRFGKDDIYSLKKMLDKLHKNIIHCSPYEVLELSDKRLTFTFVSMMLLAGNHYASPEECRRYREILDYVQTNQEELLSGDNQRMLLLDAYELLL